MNARRSRRFSSAPQPRANATCDSDEPPPYIRTQDSGPAYSITPRAPAKHTFVLKENNRNWVTLKLYSGAKSSTSLPMYFEGENIDGSLEINAETGDSINSVTVQVAGRIVTTTDVHGGGSLTFLSQSLPIWAKSTEIPRMFPPSDGALGSKLRGHCEWPFSISLPRDVAISSPAGTVQSYRLPETFLERHILASIRYDFTIHIGRGRFRPDSRIHTMFAYVPHIKPEQPSLPRQFAYRELSPLPGPESDPEGWETLPPVVSRSMLSPNHPVNILCTVSLAKPLCYTRGTIIPCTLKLESDDNTILDMFAEPTAISLRLRRRVRFFNKPLELKKSGSAPFEECVGEMGTASWWPRDNFRPDSSSRYLEGEIKLVRDLRPTTNISHFSISYFVVLCPFKVPRFNSDEQDLLSEEVDIATIFADGPRPHAYSDAPAHNPNAQRSDEYYAIGTNLSHTTRRAG